MSSCVTCNLSPVTGHLSPVTYFFLIKKKKRFIVLKNWTKEWSYLMEGLLSTGPTMSSFFYYYELKHLYYNEKDKKKPIGSGVNNDKTIEVFL